MAWESILKRLADKELITPYFEAGVMADDWPDHYTIDIDSRPYYGLDEDGRPDGYFHPSTHSLLGARELYYRFHPDTRDKMIGERRTIERQMILATGSALHGIVQAQLQMMKLVKPENIEVEYVLEEHHIRGRIDWICSHPNGEDYICEMKTRDPWIFKKREGIVPAEDAQLSLAEYSQNKTSGILLMVERGGHFQMREFLHQRNDNLLDEIFEKFAMVRQAIADNQPPRYCCTYGSPEMTGCAARFQCWLRED